MTPLSCGALAPPEIDESLALFEAGEYHAAHEVLEALWSDEQGPLRDFLKGLIQVAAVLHHLERGNNRGAARLCASAARLLEGYSPRCLGLDVATLRAELSALACRIAEDPDHIDPHEAIRIRRVPAGPDA